MNRVLPIILLSLLTASHAAGVEQTQLDPGATVSDLAIEDINGDGALDLLVLCYSEATADAPTEEKRSLVLFLRRPDGAFPTKPDSAFALPPGTGGVFFSETDGAAPREVVLVGLEGASVLRVKGEALQQTSTYDFPSLYPAGVQRLHFLEGCAGDMDSNGVDEWFVPVPGGVEIRALGEVLATIPCDVSGVTGSYAGGAIKSTYYLPGCRPFPREGASRPGLAIIGRRCVQFATGEDWSECRRFLIPYRFTGALRDLDGSREDLEGLPEPPRPSVSARLHDFNADGLPDLLIWESKGNFSVDTRVHVHLAKEDLSFNTKPDSLLDLDGSFVQPVVADVNADEKPDLLLVRLSFGVKFLMNYFIRGKVSLDIQGHFSDKGTFGEKADLKSRVALDVAPNNETGAYAFADFNGDGHLDAAFGSGGGSMVIHTGDGEQFSDDPWTTVSLVPFGVAKARKLDANESADLVVFHPFDTKQRQIDIVYF